MPSEALSEQSYVCKGAGCNEVYPSGQYDPGASYPERDLSANSPSEEEDEDLDEDESENDMDEVLGNEESNESPLRTVVNLDGLRNFVLPLIWTIDDFSSTIQRKHFNTLRDRYQIPVDVPICLPYKFEKCYYLDAPNVGMYEQMFKVGFRLPLSALHHHLAQYLGLAITQISSKAWRIFLGTEVLYGVLSKGSRRLTLEEFFDCYHSSEIVKSQGIYSFLARKPSLMIVYETPDSNRNWKNRYFFVQGDNWVCHPDERQDMPILDRTWGIVPLFGRCPFT